jgi:uncharacterized protein
VLILLPPSEGKAAAGDGPPVDLAALSLPTLGKARTRVLRALGTLCGAGSARGQRRALDVLGLSEGQRGELARNAALGEAATLPAGQIYTGVLYDALELSTLSPTGYGLLRDSVLIFSGLWGAVGLDDRIPPYRCSMGVTLPVLGGLGPFWRKAMATPMAQRAATGLVLDLRSGAYQPAWQPDAGVAARTATVRVLHERIVDGVTRRSVVSHFNKATKGRLVRDLAMAGARPQTPAELADALRDLKYTVEVSDAAPGRARQLDVIVGSPTG